MRRSRPAEHWEHLGASLTHVLQFLLPAKQVVEGAADTTLTIRTNPTTPNIILPNIMVDILRLHCRKPGEKKQIKSYVKNLDYKELGYPHTSV